MRLAIALLLLVVPGVAAADKACVAIPQVTHNVYVTSRGINDLGESHEGTTHWVLSSTREVDVDGDGVLDVLVPQPANKDTCPEQVMWKVYAVRGKCGRELGTIGPGSLAAPALPADASGFRPLVMTSQTAAYGKRGTPELTTTTRSFAVQHGHYEQTAVDTKTGVCHHCSVWHCQGVR